MAATIEGRMRGLKVVLVEKMPYIGGSCRDFGRPSRCSGIKTSETIWFNQRQSGIHDEGLPCQRA